MPVIPANQLAFLRDQHPQTARVEWYLALAPYGDACFTALANDVPPGTLVRGTMTVPYDNDAGEANVSAGMTLWVSAIGYNRYEVGRVRIKAINVVANTLTVAENSEIEWADDLYLTCPGAYGFRELWGKYPRIVDGTPVEFYVDYDDNFNSPADTVIPPKANAGPPVCAWIDPTTGNADVSFTGDASYTTELAPAAIASYLWDFADGVVIVGNVALPGTCAAPNVVRWTTPGFRYISLTVTDNTAQARIGVVYVPVWIFQDGVEDPFTQVEVLSQNGDAERGWSAKFRVSRTNSAAEDIVYNFPDGALCVLFTRTWFGNTETGVGGWCMAGDKHYRDNIRFVGWLQGETLQFDYAAGTVEFEAAAHDGIMRLIPGWPFTIEDAATPTDWYEVADLNVDRALHYLLEFYSTINQVCHVERAGEGALRPISIQKFSADNLYGQAQRDLLGDAKCRLLSDRQGILYARRDPQFMDIGDRGGVDIACALVQTDWMNQIDHDRAHRPETGNVRLGGFAYDTPLLARAPGVAPLQNARDERVDGCIVQDQVEANLWAGLTLALENNPFPQVPVDLVGYWPIFDPAYQEYVHLSANDPLDRDDWIAETFVVREVEFADDPAGGTCLTSLVLEKVTYILIGETVTVPIEPTPAAPLPPAPPLPSPWLPWTGPIKMLVAWDKGWMGWTADFLRHHVSSVATAGTGPADLFDTAVDFIALGVAVGDTVENMASGAYEHTTVSGIVDANHITLLANINLVATNAYHICGTEWVNIGPALAAHEFYIQFVPVRTGANTVGGWLLTGWDGTNPVQGSVYWAPDVLTAAPAWSEVLTIETVRAFHANTAAAEFRAIAVNAASPGYAIVSFDPALGNSGFGAVYTANYGAGWSYSVFPSNVPLNDWANDASYFGITINQINSYIYTSRECRRAAPNRFGRLLVSTDAGANFNWTGPAFSFDMEKDGRDDFYVPYQNTDVYLAAATWNAVPLYRSPMRLSGGAFTSLAIPAGMEYEWVHATMGMIGWYGDQLDILTAWHETGAAAFHFHLHRSSDGGATVGGWTDLGGVTTFFDDIPGAWDGNIAIAHQVWPPYPDVILWVGMPASGTGGHHQCRIRYTDDGGLTWYNKMGNWYLVFGSWAGAQGSSGKAGTVGAVGLPRLGANA